MIDNRHFDRICCPEAENAAGIATCAFTPQRDGCGS